MKTGLANMAYGVVIALVGAIVTGVSYSLVSGGGGTYVVAYGAIIVGAWRFLLGLFQVLRGAASGPEAQSTVPQSPGVARTAPIPVSPAQRTVLRDASGTLRLVAGLLIVDAAIRMFSLGSLLWRMRIAFGELLYNVPFVATIIVLPAVLIVVGLTVSALLLRGSPAAVPIGIGLCVVGLLFQAYGLWALLSRFAYSVPLIAWAFASVHITIYVVSLIILLRSTDKRGLAAASSQTDANAAPGTTRL